MLKEQHIFNFMSDRMEIVQKVEKLRTLIGTETINFNIFGKLKKIKIRNGFEVFNSVIHRRNFTVAKNMLQNLTTILQILGISGRKVGVGQKIIGMWSGAKDYWNGCMHVYEKSSARKISFQEIKSVYEKTVIVYHLFRKISSNLTQIKCKYDNYKNKKAESINSAEKF